MENTPTVGTTVDRFGISTEFNGDKIKAAIAAAQAKEEPATMENTEAAPWETVQTEADINP